MAGAAARSAERIAARLHRAWEARWSWVPAAVLAVFRLIYLLVSPAPISVRPDPPPDSPSRWLHGLMAVEGLHLQEYTGEALNWELEARSASVRERRTLLGVERWRLLLRVVEPSATIRFGTASVQVQARTAYHDPAGGEWIFLNGLLLEAGQMPHPFRRLRWHPAQRRLKLDDRRGGLRHPLLRFWELRE